jgi:hypothetical protein
MAQEAGGFGPQAERFVETVMEWAGNVRGVSVFGWHATNFERYWMQQIGILLVRECAKVGSAAAKGDWPRRARRANALGGVDRVLAARWCGRNDRTSSYSNARE